MAQGFVPNFAGGLRDAIKRESLAGVSKGAMRVGQDRRLATQGNPLGLASYKYAMNLAVLEMF